ncbi:MAG: hypothetical protein US34_C0024G0012 [Candidatus Nomurabacteria bacterium GW2011_GWC2_36_9]|uniref:Uncharacterized protein n=1 Tax=candidate division WS6 bacterium GW2011_GWF1_36_8 TaxID=1619098 RepID=A0A0G0IIP5_9BACT|nr:MAG: hypothetical protein US29_C0034G0005 [candidate division WS6 bacterium GW2011_GWF1_36_8]KKQ19261.1 MAG: hypothetical protein US34_C0024G0012 [Candidatus Nomurabacteria bacterium GW2011_GWC2_36_9]
MQKTKMLNEAVPAPSPFGEGWGGASKPIIYSTPMVQANLEGRKTLTRRIVKPQPKEPFIFDKNSNSIIESPGYCVEPIECPYGQPGDVLWVREKFACTLGKYEPETTYSYFADSFHWSFYPNDDMKGETACQWHDEALAKEVKWKSPRFMPKSAARIWLQIEEIKVERLQDVTEKDAIAEGVTRFFTINWRFKNYNNPDDKSGFLQAITSFQSLWGKINGPESWEQNPWVWVVKVKVLSTTGRPQSIL